jgi:hypothetical protein
MKTYIIASPEAGRIYCSYFDAISRTGWHGNPDRWYRLRNHHINIQPICLAASYNSVADYSIFIALREVS